MENKNIIKRQIQYNELIRQLIENKNKEIDITPNKENNSLIIGLKSYHYVAENNSQVYKVVIDYCELNFNDMKDFIIDLLYKSEQALINRIKIMMKIDFEKILKETEEIR